MIGSVVVGGLFYVIVTYATSIGYGVREATTAWPQSAAGISVLADHYASDAATDSRDWTLGSEAYTRGNG